MFNLSVVEIVVYDVLFFDVRYQVGVFVFLFFVNFNFDVFVFYDVVWWVLENWDKFFLMVYGKVDLVLGFFDIVF